MRVVLLFLLMLTSISALAHKPSDSYLTLRMTEGNVEAQWDIALRDLDYALGLDTDQNNLITWGELRANHTTIAAYALSRLKLSAGNRACPATVGTHLVDTHSDGAYEVLSFSAACPGALTMLTVDYRLFAELDPQHKGLLHLEAAGGTRTASPCG